MRTLRGDNRGAMTNPLTLLIVEDNPRLRPALREGLAATGEVPVVYACDSGEEALEFCLAQARRTPS